MCKKVISLFSLVLVLGLVLPGAANAVSTRLAGWWKLDDGAGTTARDSSNYGNHGTLMNGPQWVAGTINGALQFDGTDDYVDCGNGASLNVTDEITIAVWVKTNDAGNGEHNPYVAKGDQSYAMKHHPSNSIEYFIYDGGWFVARYAVDNSFNGVWHHLTGTYDGTDLKLYIDGTLETTTPHIGSIASSTYNVNLARNTQVTSRFYNGALDDVRIYNRALSDAQVQDLFNGIDPAWPKAYNPRPADGAVYTLGTYVLLQWNAGELAVEHKVYFSTDYDAVNNRDAGVLVATTTSEFHYVPTLVIGNTYYWAVDEVNDTRCTSVPIMMRLITLPELRPRERPPMTQDLWPTRQITIGG